MTTHTPVRRREHLTFKGNLRHTRYGWLRLTAAYSVHLVSDLLDGLTDESPTILDPFGGTGTTALVCAERGVPCDTTDINPFLIWLTKVKTLPYTPADTKLLHEASTQVALAIDRRDDHLAWVPPLHQIDKWWPKCTLTALARAKAHIDALSGTLPPPVTDLLKVAFCRTMIESSRVSFAHQSMSFKKQRGNLTPALLPPSDDEVLRSLWERSVATIAQAASSPILCPPRAILCDARQLRTQLEDNRYSCVITSPPYPNRMSYIRELRPYMYWLRFLSNARAAGQLDWQAIGGTWGCATSNLLKWSPDRIRLVPFPGFDHILERIAARSQVLSRYVHKYFYDVIPHFQQLFHVVSPGGAVHYIVGNSKFFDVMLPVEQIYGSILDAAGFRDVQIEPIRKRNSKKELIEYLVSARKPSHTSGGPPTRPTHLPADA